MYIVTKSYGSLCFSSGWVSRSRSLTSTVPHSSPETDSCRKCCWTGSDLVLKCLDSSVAQYSCWKEDSFEKMIELLTFTLWLVLFKLHPHHLLQYMFQRQLSMASLCKYAYMCQGTYTPARPCVAHSSGVHGFVNAHSAMEVHTSDKREATVSCCFFCLFTHTFY